MRDGAISATEGELRAGAPLPADTYIALDIGGPVAGQVIAVRRRTGYAFLGALPVEITVAGSSGLGPISPGQSAETIFGILDSIVQKTSPIVTSFGKPFRFPGTDIVALAVQDEAPFAQLQERLGSSEIKFDPSPFPFLPHCTLQQHVPNPDGDPGNMDVSIDGTFECSMLSVYSASEFPRLELRYRGYLTGTSTISV